MLSVPVNSEIEVNKGSRDGKALHKEAEINTARYLRKTSITIVKNNSVKC